MSTPDDAPPTAVALGMSRHPAGGWYRRLWAAGAAVHVTGTGRRAAASTLQHLLDAGTPTAWHRTGAEELWLHQGGGAVVQQWGGVGPAPVLAGTVTLGPADEPWAVPLLHSLVPARTWRRTLPGAREALVARTTSPEFSLEDFELG